VFSMVGVSNSLTGTVCCLAAETSQQR
jgi:hypothetical protein